MWRWWNSPKKWRRVQAPTRKIAGEGMKCIDNYQDAIRRMPEITLLSLQGLIIYMACGDTSPKICTAFKTCLTNISVCCATYAKLWLPWEQSVVNLYGSRCSVFKFMRRSNDEHCKFSGVCVQTFENCGSLGRKALWIYGARCKSLQIYKVLEYEAS